MERFYVAGGGHTTRLINWGDGESAVSFQAELPPAHAQGHRGTYRRQPVNGSETKEGGDLGRVNEATRTNKLNSPHIFVVVIRMANSR